ncbi:MAG: GYDIA family GHMP kinase [Lutibacter sp.]
MMNSYYSHGKLLISGEYLVLDGAEALAIPTKFGQNLKLKKIEENQLIWKSYLLSGEIWFEAIFELPKIKLVSATFNSSKEGSSEFIAENLRDVLLEARNLNNNFLNSTQGYLVETHLEFPKNWGFGSSSTFINNLANWANVNPYKLLANTFGGSGYDIACAASHSPIIFKKEESPIIESINFKPNFSNHLYFVFLNNKQNSREGIKRYKELKSNVNSEIQEISAITKSIIKCDSLSEFEKLIVAHEEIISSIIKMKPVQEQFFSNYFGKIKSLGAWGGDFILATGNKQTPKYFYDKGFKTVLKYQDVVL